jgi:S1-C subfamily serine protease
MLVATEVCEIINEKSRHCANRLSWLSCRHEEVNMRAVLVIVLLVAAELPVRRGEDRDKVVPPASSGPGFLGIMVQPGAPEIAGFAENSPSEKAGLQAGDVITKVKRKNIGSFQDLLEVMQKTRPGERVSVTVTRDGRERTVTVTLGTRPTEP